jgi:hypothetical protein
MAKSMFGICNKYIRRDENSEVNTGVNKFTHYISTELNFTIGDSVKLYIHGSVHHKWFSRNTIKMQLCNRIYYFKVYWRLNIFRAAHRSSSGGLNCCCGLCVIYPCGDRPATTWVYKPETANAEPLINFGKINFITKLHLVGISTECVKLVDLLIAYDI